MANSWPASGQEQIIPFRFSFITLRPERFGALVFNPYLGIEEELDPIEAYIAALCNDANSCRQIQQAAQERFTLSPSGVQKQIDKTMKKLWRLCAVSLRPGVSERRTRLPDTTVFPDDGPCLSAPRDVIWDVTHACNLHCPHCLTDSGTRRQAELDTQQALSIVDALAEAQVFSLCFSGGEPLLRPDILTLLRHAGDCGLRVDIATNGQLLTDSLLCEMRSLPIFHVQVSIDGIAQQHDRFRGRRGAFAAACTAIRRLQDEGIATSISTTVTSENVGTLDAIIDFALGMQCQVFKAIPFLPAGRGKKNAARLRLTRGGHQQLSVTLQRRSKELGGQLIISGDTTFGFLVERPPVDVCCDGSMGCRAGHDTLSIGPDGMAYPCPFLQDFPLGNLLQRSLKRVWNEAPILRTLRQLKKQDLGEPCKGCRYAPKVCRGGCRAAAYLEYGDLRAADPNCFQPETACASR